MKRIETNLPGVCILEPQVFEDERGFFLETYRRDRFRDLGIDSHFVQDNHSKSACGTLRGLHFQLNHPQAKLCRVVAGEVLDVAVDIRRDSSHFGKWTSVLLSAANKRLIFVPRGFAHGFVVLSESAEFLYKCDDVYHPEDERGVAWDDPQIGIDWQLAEHGIESPLLSRKDGQNLPLQRILEHDLPRL